MVRYACYAVAAFGLAALALAIGPRVLSPWPLEWMEGASLHHALRLAAGQPLYAEPRAEFIAFVYPPLAYLPMALSASLFGPTLLAARIPSLLGLLAALLCLGRIATREGGHAAFGWLAAGLYALGFGYTGAFFDLARVDSVFMALIFLAAERWSASWQAPQAPSGWAVVWALIWLGLATLAKQHGAIFLCAFSLGLLLRAPRAHAWQLAGVWFGLGLGLLLLDAASGGWFRIYAWDVPAGHGIVPSLLVSYLTVDVLVYLPVLVLCLGLAFRHRLDVPGRWSFWLLAALAASALGRAHPGGDDNVRMPGFGFMVLVGTLGFARLVSRADSWRARAGWCAALALQALILLQPPAAHWPSRESQADFAALQAALGRCSAAAPGVALDHALLTERPYFHTMALSDLRAAGGALGARATDRVIAELGAPNAPGALAVSASFPGLEAALARHYHLCELSPSPRLAAGYTPGRTRIYTRSPR
jgi:Dolichyl-phosphate-mannose-protein mannosyltransferase